MSKFLVKMDTPNRCCDCPMCYDYILCRLAGKEFGEIECVEIVADWCPLIKIPPHGRLIDASEVITVQVYEDQYEDYRSVSMTIDDLLSQSWIDAKAPTVIPASEEAE